MRKIIAICLSLFMAVSVARAEKDSTEIFIQQIESSLKYETGTIKLAQGNGTLVVPKGFGFLNQEQARYVLEELWGNPASTDIIGLLVPEGKGVLADDSWAFSVSYDGMGYVEDKDAKEINYDDLMKDLKKEQEAENVQRVKENYPPITIIGWASKPYYDEQTHTLHWARELNFGGDSSNTLNYNLRVLGRKGMYLLNAISRMNEFNEVKPTVDAVIGSVTFASGETYKDFDSKTDNVAAYTVGGLVAGKVLAKAGFFALLAKFGKFILIGLAGLGAFLFKRFRKKKEDDFAMVETAPVPVEESKENTPQ